MTRIRLVEISNFRSIKSVIWHPGSGLNCLIGPGDSGKSTILDAIDLCLSARRSLSFADTDFYGMDVSQDIVISLTLGALNDSIKNLERYGECLRGYDELIGTVEDEPRKGLETVVTVRLTVRSDLEPQWTLYADRTAQLDPSPALQWRDRVQLAPARLGSHPVSNLSWTRGSVLNRLSEERAEVGAVLVTAAREARASFGAKAAPQLEETLKKVTETARQLGVNVGKSATALLDAHSASFGDGAISVHSENGIPLRSMGTGSTRLLVAGLHRAAAEAASVVLVDEVEHGLDPHRLIRLLDSLGAKEERAPLQVFMTTHSPVVLRELRGNQLTVLRARGPSHDVQTVGTLDIMQSTVRLYPEAFLAKTVILCEGASEVGLLRGLDQFWTEKGYVSLQAAGIAYVDVGGGDADRAFDRAVVFQRLGYRVAVVQDNDKTPTTAKVQNFVAAGGHHLIWRDGRSLEDELFASLRTDAVYALLQRALELTEDGLVDKHIVSLTQGAASLNAIWQEGQAGNFSPATRAVLGRASRVRKAGWFKSITKMQGVAHDILGPHLDNTDGGFTDGIQRLIRWAYENA